MSGQGEHIAWFIALSAALHTAVMLIGDRRDTSIGSAGELVYVSMSYRAGAAGQPPAAAGYAAGLPARRSPPQVTTKRPAPAPSGWQAAGAHHDNPPREAATAPPVSSQQTGAASRPEEPESPAHGSGTDRATTEEQLRRSILQLVSSRFDYPLMARRKGMQGTVRLQVRIESDGRISRLLVEQSSGYPVLDRAALQSLQLASVPDARQWMNGQSIDIIIPVEYRLVGG